MDVLYAPLESVTAVMVHHLESSLADLSGGGVAPRPAQIPGRLVLERSARALAPPVVVDWAALGTDEGACAAVALALDGLALTLSELRADPLGREALEAKVQGIHLLAGAAVGLALVDRQLRLTFLRAGTEVFGPTDLPRAVASVL